MHQTHHLCMEKKLSYYCWSAQFRALRRRRAATTMTTKTQRNIKFSPQFVVYVELNSPRIRRGAFFFSLLFSSSQFVHNRQTHPLTSAFSLLAFFLFLLELSCVGHLRINMFSQQMLNLNKCQIEINLHKSAIRRTIGCPLPVRRQPSHLFRVSADENASSLDFNESFKRYACDRIHHAKWQRRLRRRRHRQQMRLNSLRTPPHTHTRLPTLCAHSFELCTNDGTNKNKLKSQRCVHSSLELEH